MQNTVFKMNIRSAFYLSISMLGLLSLGAVSAKDIPGATQTSYAVNQSGAFQFSVPIIVPQGVNGVQPNLALSFSSSHGNGRVGVGWDVAGLSSITRCGMTLAVHGRRKGVTYTQDDRFCLDGKPLLLVSGEHGKVGAEYRTQIDEFSKVVVESAASKNLDDTTAPTTFRVYRKDGSIWDYGQASSAVRLKSPHTNVIHCWKVYKVQDRNGNAYRVSYRDADGQPDKITYNALDGAEGNKLIDFVYENRTDVRISYQGGTRFTYNQRLSRLDVRQSGTVVRQYKLAYQYSQNHQSQLTGITECGIDGAGCMPEIKVAWQTDSKGYVQSPIEFKPPTYLIEYLDYNRVLAPGNPPVAENRIKQINRGALVDVNGDGDQDVVLAYVTHGGTPVTSTYIKTATGWDEQDTWALPHPLRNYSNNLTNYSSARFREGMIQQGQLVDVNADGLVDVVYSYRFMEGPHQVISSSSVYQQKRETYINTGSGWTHDGNYDLPDYAADYVNHDFSAAGLLSSKGQFADVNGDGLVDWVSAIKYRGTSVRKTWLNTGSGWALSSAYQPPSYLREHYGADHQWQRSVLADVNGDGLLDWVEAYHTIHTSLATASRKTWLNTGTGFADAPSDTFKLPGDLFEYNFAGVSTTQGSLIDFNGDGRADFIRAYTGVIDHQAAWFNTGNGWQLSSEYKPPFTQFDYTYVAHSGPHGSGGSASGGWGAQVRGHYIDVNGDGLVDFTQAYKDVFNADHRNTWLNTGEGWSEDNSYNYSGLFFDYHARHLSKANFGQFADINRDGRADWVQLRRGVAIQSYVSQSGRASLLDHVTTSMGVRIDPKFAPLSSSTDLYTQYPKQANGDAVPTEAGGFYVKPSSYVTESLTRPTPEDGVNSVTSYHYEGLQVERVTGFLGFKTFTATSSLTGLSSIVQLNQTYPYIGRAETSATMLGTEVLNVSQTQYAHQAQTLPDNTKLLQVSVTRSESSSYELPDNGGALYRRSVVDGLNYDAYLNVESQRTRIFDGNGTVLHTAQVQNDFKAANEANWLVAQVELVTQTSTTAGKAAVVNQAKYLYNSASRNGIELGQLHKAISEPNVNDATIRITSEFTYDARGNIELEKSYASDGGGNLVASADGSTEVRQNQVSYDAEKRLPISITNTLGQSSAIVYHPHCDLPTTVTDANNLISTSTYDHFCRAKQEVTPEGLVYEIDYLLSVDLSGCSVHSGSDCQADPMFSVRTTSPTEPAVTRYYNQFNQVILATTSGVADQLIRQLNYYDALGRLSSSSQPFFEGQTQYWTNYEYDVLGRNIKTELPYDADDGSRAEMQYEYGINSSSRLMERTSIDLKGRANVASVNALGQVVTVTDAAGENLSYRYDSQGNLTQTEDAHGNTISLGYDIIGRRTTLNDPDLGTSTYAFNQWSDLVSQTDAKNQVITMQYDALSRLVQRTVPGGAANSGGVSTWEYDTASWGGTGGLQGAIAKVTGPNGYERSFEYDQYGRLNQEDTRIKGIDFTERYAYNPQNGYLAERFYPSSGVDSNGDAIDFGVQYSYTNGYLTSILSTENEAGQCIEHWRAESYDALGRVESETLGKLVATQRVFKPGQNVLERIRSITIKGTPNLVQNLEYTYDAMNNLTSRNDYIGEVGLESFKYDVLDRLTHHYHGTELQNTGVVEVEYDAIGNITRKSDVGSYAYLKNNGKNTHRLQAITNGPSAGSDLTQFNVNWDFDGQEQLRSLPDTNNLTFNYDNNGSVTQSNDREISWTAFDKPERILSRNNASGEATGSIYEYGPEQQRVYKKEAKFSALSTVIEHGEETIYLGKYYERIYRPSTNAVTHRYTIETGGHSIQIERQDNSAQDKPTYLLADNLGSTNVVLNALGQVEERLAFDPWGMRLNVGNQSSVNSVTNRGYTGHEMDDETGLINMNARVYDPYIGRFLSADPVLPDPTDMQAFNRYAYVLGNPLKYTDPTGNMPDYVDHPCGFLGELCGPDGNPNTGGGGVGGGGAGGGGAGGAGGAGGGGAGGVNSPFCGLQGEPSCRTGLPFGLDYDFGGGFPWSGPFGGQSPTDYQVGRDVAAQAPLEHIRRYAQDLGIDTQGLTYEQIANAINSHNMPPPPEPTPIGGESNTSPSTTAGSIARQVLSEAVNLFPGVEFTRALLNPNATRTDVLSGAASLIPAGKVASLAVKGAIGLFGRARKFLSATKGGSVGAARRLQFEASPKHGLFSRNTSKGVASRGPTDGQHALDTSIQIKNTSPRRIGVDKANGEIVVFPQTTPGVFHGFVTPFKSLTTQQQNALRKSGLVDKKGNIN